MTQSVAIIRSSNGVGNASTATVQNLRSSGATSIIVDTVADWPTKFCATMGTPHTFVDPVTSETITVISEASAVDFIGHIDTGHIEIDAIAPGYTDADGSAVGDIVIVRPTTQWADNVWAVLAQHLNDDGSLSTAAVNTALNIGAAGSNGWIPSANNPNTVVANGNRSYTLTFNAVDLRTTLSPGMRLRTQRTAVAPSQCTSLNGTTQYFVKTSPNKMTFTNNFVISAWVKLGAYNTAADQVMVSRYNGTSGFTFKVNPGGSLQILAFNGGASNYLASSSTQAIPISRWTHLAGQMDMTTTSVGGTNNYMMFDGVEVPNTTVRNGTSPTALIQAGNLEIGSQNGGTAPFTGKIAQVAIYSAKVTEANIRATMSQGLVGNETSLVSAYSFNNSITDLNTTTPNDLSVGGGSAVATNADSPFGAQANGTISTTLDYAIIERVAFSTNTTLTVQVPEGCTIPTSGGVSSLVYAPGGLPYGFPGQKSKWRLSAVNRTSTGTTSSATYNPFNSSAWILPVPNGQWNVGYQCDVYNASTTQIFYNLSTTSAPLSALSPTVGNALQPFGARLRSSAAAEVDTKIYCTQPQEVTIAMEFYTMYTGGATTAGGIDGTAGYSEIFAENAYL